MRPGPARATARNPELDAALASKRAADEAIRALCADACTDHDTTNRRERAEARS